MTRDELIAKFEAMGRSREEAALVADDYAKAHPEKMTGGAPAKETAPAAKAAKAAPKPGKAPEPPKPSPVVAAKVPKVEAAPAPLAVTATDVRRAVLAKRGVNTSAMGDDEVLVRHQRDVGGDSLAPGVVRDAVFRASMPEDPLAHPIDAAKALTRWGSRWVAGPSRRPDEADRTAVRDIAAGDADRAARQAVQARLAERSEADLYGALDARERPNTGLAKHWIADDTPAPVPPPPRRRPPPNVAASVPPATPSVAEMRAALKQKRPDLAADIDAGDEADVRELYAGM